MREPRYLNSFYPEKESELLKAIESSYLHEKGPGALPGKRKNNALLGVISPHAGYQYSGPAAAWSYKAIAEATLPDVYIILAPNHHSATSGISIDSWRTPLGILRSDQNLGRGIASKGNIAIREDIHLLEHSIEVQLPFLIHTFRKEENAFILPMIISHDVDLKALALDIKEVLMDLGRRAIFIVSSDFTHYGRLYRYMPFTMNPLKQVYEHDSKILNYIKNMDPDAFLDFIRNTDSTVCGFLPIALMLYILGKARVRVEQYYTSADLGFDKNNFVAYASVLFEK